MGMRLPTNSRNALVDTLVDRIDAGAGAGKLRLYDGAAPGTPGGAITTQTLLAEFTLSDPAFGNSGAAVAGRAAANAIADVSGLADGDVGWFRVVDSDGNVVWDNDSVSVSGGGGQLEMNTLTISTGVDVAVTSWTVTTPAS